MRLGKALMAHCQDKTRFADRPEALAAMKELKEQGALKPTHRVYRCAFCNGYHIGRHKRR